MPNRISKGKVLAGAVNVPAGGLYIADTVVNATAAELNRVADASSRVVNGTAAGTLTITEATHDGKVVLLNRAAGFDVALPAATGSGTNLKFVVATTGTAPYVIRAAGNDAFWGVVHQVSDNAGAGTSVWGFKSGGGTVITLNGSTTGGIKGDVIELCDILTDIWFVNMRTAGTGAEATPFS
jgi:hypothetical protein